MCAQFHTLRFDVGRLSSQHIAGVAKEKQLSIELEQERVDWLRVGAELKTSLLEVNQLRKMGLAKDKELTELASMATTEKSLLEDAVRDCLCASMRGDKLQIQVAEAQANVRAYKHKLQLSHHELQLTEPNLIAEWSARFYSEFDTLVEVVKDKFPGVELSGLKAEDYADEVGAEVGSPLAAKVPKVEFGCANPEAVAEGEGTSGAIPIPMSANSPLPIPEISLADQLAVDASLASIDQAALSLMVISKGGLEGQTTLYRKKRQPPP